jgi:hypothetical protein
MPYLSEEARTRLIERLDADGNAMSPAELNFVLCAFMLTYWEDLGPSYQALNDIIGAMDLAKAEFWRRVVVPYEAEKCDINGDIFP